LAAERPNVFSFARPKESLAPEERNVPLGNSNWFVQRRVFRSSGASKFLGGLGSINIWSRRDQETKPLTTPRQCGIIALVDYTLRKASLDDRAAIEQLIIDSARGLSRSDYSAEQIEGAIATVFGVDTNLIIDGTYFVTESDGELIGCGGWSKRKTLFGGDQYQTRDASQLDPKTEPAKIRAFFIHPQHARKGIARAILDACEAEAKACGFQAIELMSTLPGIKLYRACGYQGDDRVELEVGDGVTIGLLPMTKELE